jgi:hypothetical protein
VAWESSIAKLLAVSRALITTQERTPGTPRFLCGFDAHGSPPGRELPAFYAIPPYGMVKEEIREFEKEKPI